MTMTAQRAIPLAAFLVLVVGGGILIGYATAPGLWYAGLIKPAFNPPGWIFGPVWTILYIFIAIAGWRQWRIAQRGAAMKLWAAQLALNFLWSPLFFEAHRIDAALVTIVLLLGSILLFVRQTWDRDRSSALLFLPYAAWVAFASVLNGAILYLNI